MTKIATIPRTGCFAWHSSPSHTLPLLATGTAAGALDESFSSEGKLEVWEVFPGEKKKVEKELGGDDGMKKEEGGEGEQEEDDDFLKPEGRRGDEREPIVSYKVGSRFCRLAWSAPFPGRPQGVLAAGMESGELVIYDPVKMLAGASASEATIFQATKHKGPVRGLDFNGGKTKQILASGSSDGEIFIWDMSTLSSTSTHYTPGSGCSKPGDVTSLAWNSQKEHILASSLSSGYCIIWDLRSKKEIRTFQYGGAASSGGPMGAVGAGAGGRVAMSSVCWHPENPLFLVTASEDDSAPIIMMWNLQNSLAPEKIFTGHDKGILSVSWCKQDPELLLSCGKDNRTILWNPSTAEMLGELPSSGNWAFQTAWNPRNPDILATASFDGNISINSLQSTDIDPNAPPTTRAAGGDLFDDPDFLEQSSGISLKQPPRWLRRPVSASFGFGGILTSTSNLQGADGKTQSATVHLRTVITEPSIVERAEKLQAAVGSKEDLGTFCDARSKDAGTVDVAAWKALSSLFTANSRNELVGLLGFSKEEVAEQVSQAIKKFKADNPNAEVPEPAVEEPSADTSMKVPEFIGRSGDSVVSERDTSASSVVSESETPSLFGDEDGTRTPALDAPAPSLSSMGPLRSALPDHVRVPHHNVEAESSVGATIGSRASSVTSESLKVSTFKIYPSEESEVDRLITRALVLGDFESAVSLCLSSDRFADAILLAVRGGPELLSRTQKNYFERRTTSLPYLRLFQSIVSDDLTDVVQNADLAEWQEIFVVLCTFAKQDEFNGLAEQLGQRIEHQYRVAAAAGGEGDALPSKSKDLRKNATLCYLAARKLEKVVTIWADEMKEEEDAVVTGSSPESRYTAHAQALQSFIEKVTVFQSATGYTDKDLASPTESEAVAESGARTYKLSSLYERYFEYADLLATQGLVAAAGQYVKMTPSDFQVDGSGGRDLARERFLGGDASAAQAPVASSSRAPAPVKPSAAPQASTAYPTYPSSNPPQPQQAQAPTSSPYTPYGVPEQQQKPSSSPYGAPSTSSTSNNAPAPSSNGPYGKPASTPYAPANPSSSYGSYGGQPQQQQQQGSYPYNNGRVAPPPSNQPPPPRNLNIGPPPIPAAQRRDIPGWNDSPAALRPSSAQGLKAPAPITSPFPNSPAMTPPPPMSPQMGAGPPQAQGGFFPPPPRGSSARPPPPPAAASANKPRVAPPPPAFGGMRAPPPPARTASPLGPGRVGSPSNAPRMPSANMAAARPPPPPSSSSSAYAPPPGSAQSPPPGRGPAGQSRPPAPPASVAAPAPPPVAPKHPAGDRSHIPEEDLPIFEQIQFLFDYIKTLPPPNPQIAQELTRVPAKLNILFDKLNNEEVSADLLKKLRSIAKSMENRQLGEAFPFLLNVITNTQFNGELPALTALKLLIQLAMSPPQ